MINENKLIEFIKVNELDAKNRSRQRVYQRSILYRFLRDRGYTLEMIGHLFSRDHATVLHGLKMADVVCNYPDYKTEALKLNIFLNDLIDQDQVQQLLTVDEVDSFQFRMISCRTLRDFRNLQREVLTIMMSR